MAYVDPNFKTKKALKKAIANDEPVYVFQPGGMFPLANSVEHTIEGPHYPEPHRWYARVKIDPRTRQVIAVVS